VTVPDGLRRRSQWVGYRLEQRGDPPKPTKVPVNPSNDRNAKVDDPTTWATFKKALEAVERYKLNGVGFVFTGGDAFCGIDLDKCRDLQTREVQPWAAEIIQQLDSYTEVSPSGTGVHIIIHAELHEGKGRKFEQLDERVELYDRGRFFCTTGAPVEGTLSTIEDRQRPLDKLISRLGDRHGKTGRTAGDHRADSYAEGGRHEALLSRAGQMCRTSASQTEIEAALIVFNRERCRPPKSEAEVRKLATDVAGRYEAGGLPADLVNFRATDLGNAELLTRLHGDKLRYRHVWQKWLIWDGRRWRVDDSRAVYRLAVKTIRHLYNSAGNTDIKDERTKIANHAIRCESKARLDAMVALAANQEALVVRPDDLDQNGTLLNVENGTLDLRTGVLRPHDRNDLITKMVRTSFDPEAQCPLWMKFLHLIFQGDITLINFVQRTIGYALTANTGEQCLFLCHGDGANGKSTFIETILYLLGDYGLMTPSETLFLKRNDGIPNDVALLKGKRFVAAIESEENRSLAESKIKSMTRGDTITARFMRGEWFEFEPEFKLFLVTNHRPRVRGTDRAIWRRIRLIPFDYVIPEPERDRDFKRKLIESELPGILRGAVQGGLEWRAKGLQPPDTVKFATEEYRESEDQVGRSIEEWAEKGRSWKRGRDCSTLHTRIGPTTPASVL